MITAIALATVINGQRCLTKQGENQVRQWITRERAHISELKKMRVLGSVYLIEQIHTETAVAEALLETANICAP